MIKNFSIRTRLLAGFFLVAIIACLIGYVGISKIHQIGKEDTRLYENVTNPMGQLANMLNDFQKLRAVYRDTYIEKDISERQKTIQEQDDLMKDFEINSDIFEKTIDNDDANRMFSDVKSNYSDLKKTLAIYNSNLLDRKDDDALALRNSIMMNYSVSMEKSLYGLFTSKITIGKNISDENASMANVSAQFMFILIILGLVAAVLLGLLSSNSITKIIKNVNFEVKRLTKAAIDGKLQIRGEPEKINEEFRSIIYGVNETLDSVIDPLNMAANYIDRISKGDVPPKIIEEYNGDFNIIKNNLNQCIDAINLLVSDANILAKAAIDGKLQTRVEADTHFGNFRKIIEGFNHTLDAVIGPMNVTAKYIELISIGDMPEIIKDEYRGDFNKIKNNINSLISAIGQIVEKAKMVASGDLTVSLEKRSDKDELMNSLNEMVKSTSNIIIEFRKAADSIASASIEISTGSQQMSQGATEQASSSEEVSSSMEEMVSNIEQNTDNAQQTERIALAASDGIRLGNNSVEISVSAMKDIAAKIKIINDIAFQTNILALNAAVEAARAGEHGKGFAVVAAEVRKLAERSKVAADEIDELSRNGVEVSERAGKQLASLVPEIEKTTKLVQEITAASIEQNSGAGQINNAIQQLNQVTQQNAAASEEMATNAEELSQQAEQLKEIIAFFKLNYDASAEQSQFKNNTTANIRKESRYGYSYGTKSVQHIAKQKTSKGMDIKMRTANEINDGDYSHF
jgi:methyl-accepting chemotaxis protein